jgi:hypothetical protein
MLLNISSPSSAYRKRCCKDKPHQLISSRSFSSVGSHHAHPFRNFKLSCIMLYAKPWEHPSAVATLSYRYPAVSLNQLFHPLHSCFCHSLNRATWSGLIWDFRTSLREFLDPVVNRFTRQTHPTVNRKHFLWIFSGLNSFVLKNTTERCTSVILLKHIRHFDYWNQPLNMRMRVCYQDYHEAGLCCYLVIYIGNLLQLFYFHLWPIILQRPVVLCVLN